MGGGGPKNSRLTNLQVIEFQPNTTLAEIKQFIKDFNKDTDIEYASPILLNEAGEAVGAMTDEFIVKLKPKTSLSALQYLAEQTKTQIHRRYEYDSLVYILKVDKKSLGNSMEMANVFYNSTVFEYAEPNLLVFVQKSYVPNDPRLTEQWALSKMQVFDAWDIINGGCSAIRIGIIDDGVDLTHPDLQANMNAGIDYTGNNTNGGPTNPANMDSHGTFIAGIVAAIGNNNLGIAGIAYNCRIVPIKAVVTNNNLPFFMNANFRETITQSIDWAITRADVINMSFGINSNFQMIRDALFRAVSFGRNGLGCILVGASGNGNSGTVIFPASEPNVIAVGASAQNDTRTNFSNYGTGLDVVAPGIDILSTDRQGNAGYSNNNYHTDAGTSFAAPQVAGIAALILSLNPSLRWEDVRHAIESTADKVGGYNYQPNANQPNGTWNSEMGHGRVNAKSALRRVQIIGSDALSCNGDTASYIIPYLNAVDWTVSAGLEIVSGQRGKRVVVRRKAGTSNPIETVTANVGGTCGGLVKQVFTPVVPPIAGPDALACHPATAQYSMQNVPANAVVTWSSPSGNLTITPTQTIGSQSVTVQRTPTGNGTAYLQATVTGFCQPIVKEILGFPDPSKISLNRFGQNCSNGESRELLGVGYDGAALHEQYYSGLPAPPNGTQGILEVEWNFSPSYGSMQLIQPTAVGLSCGTSHNIICRNTAQIRSIGDAGGIVLVRVRNCVGWSGWRQFPISGVNCYDIYPCGRVGSFSVVAKSKDDKSNALTELVGENIDFEAKLYDLNGNVVKEGKSKGRHRIDWDTSDLKEGQYILRTVFNGKVSSQHVLVNSACCGGGGGC